MSGLAPIANLFRDPPPEFVFEIAADSVAICRSRAPYGLRELPLEPGVIVPAQGKDSVAQPAAFAAAVQKLIPSPFKRRTAALLLPDSCVRLALLDFEKFPDKEEERNALVKFRLRKTVPFDVDQAAVSYFIQSAGSALVAAAPLETIARFEAPFRAAGLQPGLVMPSSLAMLEMVRMPGLLLAARQGSGSLSVFALRDGVVLLARVLELTQGTADPLEEIIADLYPTMVYLEDQTGSRPSRLVLAGMEEQLGATARLSAELDLPVELLPGRHPGIAGYLASLGASLGVHERAVA